MLTVSLFANAVADGAKLEKPTASVKAEQTDNLAEKADNSDRTEKTGKYADKNTEREACFKVLERTLSIYRSLTSAPLTKILSSLSEPSLSPADRRILLELSIKQPEDILGLDSQLFSELDRYELALRWTVRFPTFVADNLRWFALDPIHVGRLVRAIARKGDERFLDTKFTTAIGLTAAQRDAVLRETLFRRPALIPDYMRKMPKPPAWMADALEIWLATDLEESIGYISSNPSEIRKLGEENVVRLLRLLIRAYSEHEDDLETSFYEEFVEWADTYGIKNPINRARFLGTAIAHEIQAKSEALEEIELVKDGSPFSGVNIPEKYRLLVLSCILRDLTDASFVDADMQAELYKKFLKVPQDLIRYPSLVVANQISRNTMGQVGEALGIPNADLLPLANKTEGESIESVLQQLALKHPTILPPGAVGMISDHTHDRDLAIRLLGFFLRSSFYKPDLARHTDSLQFMCDVAGLEAQGVCESAVGAAPKEFYELLLDLSQDNLNEMPIPLFRGITVDARVFGQKAAWIDFLSAIRNLHAWRGRSRAVWNWIVDEFDIRTTGLRPENLQSLTQEMRLALVRDVSEGFGTEESKFDAEQFDRLRESWGDLEPIFTLIARFKSDPDWNDELPVLRDVLLAELAGTFKEFKFHGPKGNLTMRRTAEAQLAGLTGHGLNRWMQGLSLASVADDGENPTIVFSTMSSDAKFLLTIGDLVKATSCQNYRTGCMIESLLGYVIDANVQAMASFAIAVSHFETKEAYRRVVDALSKGKATYVFDGNRRQVKFSLKESGEVVTTRALGNAYLRQMVKLGATSNNKVGIRLEKEYSSSHPLMATMKDQHQALHERLGKDLKAAVKGAITVKQTRNPGGVYSDLGGGLQDEDYEIQ